MGDRLGLPSQLQEGKLALAMERLGDLPVLRPARARLLSVSAEDSPDRDELVAVVESDLGLVTAVLRSGAEASRPTASVRQAVGEMASSDLNSLAERGQSFELFSSDGALARFESLWRHAVSVQRVAARVAAEVGFCKEDELTVSALLHDIGKLVLGQSVPGYPASLYTDARSPEARVAREHQVLGLDHAWAGGELIRKWGLPGRLAMVVERHHTAEDGDEATVIRMADMLAHYEESRPFEPAQLLRVSLALGLGREALGDLVYDLALPLTRQIPGPASPLTARETQILRELSAGKVYKQIAIDLGVSHSTVRAHAHNIYGKLRVPDRAQAVLFARSRHWI